MGKVCVKCGSEWVVNNTYCLCDKCNYLRLHGETRFEVDLRKEKEKPKKIYHIKRKPVKSSVKTTEKRKLTLTKDKQTYRRVFNSRPHECEECGEPLPEQFLDEEGNIIAIWQYSHILTKQSHPEFRHNELNFNRLCWKHHEQWEFGDREIMKIFNINQETINRLKNG